MQITAEKLTDRDLMRRACEMTMRGGSSKVSLARMYRCEHSPMRTQLFWIEMHAIPTFVSVHLVRHKIGVEHFVMSNRDDRGGAHDTDRYSPVNHGMLIDAQALVNMARKRLCRKSHTDTIAVMQALRSAIDAVDPDLAAVMVPECEYRGGFCHELKPCGLHPLAE
ncbi:MAG: hypothetical protein ACOCYV_02630 [Planctomycetota bacterium]